MPQRVEYEVLPGTRYDQYIFKLRPVLTSLQTGPSKFKVFRDFLRKQGIYDKDKSGLILSVVDITMDKKEAKLGKFGKRLAGMYSDADFQDALFERLKDLNILLVKYVLEALDVESGGRLHSVHELYRMITSYVYPGTYITLPHFQAWIDWMAATGYIKLVGIRWALSEKGMKAVSELRAMDVEEILEDMEDEDEEEDDDVDDDDDDDDDAPAPASGGGARKKAASDDDFSSFDDEEEDLFADLPPEPDLPSESALKAAAASFEDEFDDVPGGVDPLGPPPTAKPARGSQSRASAPTGAAKRGAAPPPVGAPSTTMAVGAGPGLHAPVAFASYAPVAVVSLEDADTAALADRIGAWYQTLSDWPAFDAEALGVQQKAGASDLALLVELGVLATLVEGLAPQPQVFAFVKRLRATTFFASLGHGEGLEECLDAMERTGSEPWARALFERLVHARFVARRVSMKIDLLPELRNAADGAALIALLREHLLGHHWVEAPFWVARELVRLGVLDTAAAQSVAAVPTRRLRENAARIGLVRSADVLDHASLLALVQQVAKLFGAQAGYGAALEQLDLALGLTM
ncbi:MAG: hypothetical protein KC635_08135 [Myxococcales bacterium]|nr:hypothetical protein [Myxococcales bacterium]MCB9736412.1 hypothetical protein [Deltaproteobacteria bacterium]